MVTLVTLKICGVLLGPPPPEIGTTVVSTEHKEPTVSFLHTRILTPVDITVFTILGL